jgi:hypothetical protein
MLVGQPLLHVLLSRQWHNSYISAKIGGKTFFKEFEKSFPDLSSKCWEFYFLHLTVFTK